MKKSGWVIGTALLLCLTSGAWASEKFPSREIQIITTNPAGQFVDIALRLMSDTLSKNLGVPVVVVNRPGAGGATGTQFLVKSKPDGYTIGCLAPRDTIFVPATMPNIPYKHTDLEPLCRYSSNPTGLFLKGDAPWKTWGDLVADAKKRPGEITYGVSTNSISQFQLRGFFKFAGINLLEVPVADAGQAVMRVLGGNLDLGATSPVNVRGQLNAGTLRALFIISPERMRLFPQLATHKEVGLPEPVITLYNGFFVPAGVPKPVKETLEKALEKTIKDPAVKRKLEDVSFVLEYLPSAAFAQRIEEEYRLVIEHVKAQKAK